MVAAAEALMTSGFRVVYAYTQSDEISLLFAQGEKQYGRKLRKYDSTLAAEASARFSLALGQVATFDCRVSQLPNVELVVDYFRWRSEDAVRNALNAHCYWALRREGRTEREATDRTNGLSVSEKNELLYRLGLNFNDVPAWQKRGTGLYWEDYERSARNPLTGAEAVARRRRIRKDFDLPMKREYGEFVRGLVAADVGAERSRQ
jgi:tRNA(His) 5'-end guanylyltransferase